jgi:hypothetical protein
MGQLDSNVQSPTEEHHGVLSRRRLRTRLSAAASASAEVSGSGGGGGGLAHAAESQALVKIRQPPYGWFVDPEVQPPRGNIRAHSGVAGVAAPSLSAAPPGPGGGGGCGCRRGGARGVARDARVVVARRGGDERAKQGSVRGVVPQCSAAGCIRKANFETAFFT